MTAFRVVGLLVFGQFLLSSCAQFTTSDSDRAELAQAAQAEAAEYLECIRAETRTFAGQNVAAEYVTQVTIERCAGALAEYEAAETVHLNSMYMMPDQILEEDVEELNKQARVVVAEEMANLPAVAAGAPAAAPVVAPAAAPAAAAATSAPASSAPAALQADERVYLDCIESQASRFAALDESAETIAEVAHNRCAQYAGASAGALAPRGRALALDTVFEARLPSAD